jgi:hypothetical protein
MNSSLLTIYNNINNKDVIINSFNKANDKILNFFDRGNNLLNYDNLQLSIFRLKNYPIISDLSNINVFQIRNIFEGDLNFKFAI